MATSPPSTPFRGVQSYPVRFNTDVTDDMIFLETDVTVSDVVIGKGAFGEVRLAKWRNIDIAAKRLHPLVIEKEASQIDGSSDIDPNHCAVVDSFRTEMETLAKLRHPNLVLFLGVACNPKTRQPTTILTELLPGSLYDILEVHKIKLSLPEVLDMSIDICCGLEYLHSHNPQIVHRDISSKNILVGGNRAKIADLGQAKLFETALSRQTSLPGAMAYSAPEVLTGRYTSKIDIFSFGILLCQMCSGDYPRIDKREEQLRTSCEKFPVFKKILEETVSYQPSDRPTSTTLCESLKSIRHNDRYYPPSRGVPPQSDIGVMARKYMDDAVEQRCGDIRLALEQTARRLEAEEQRWRDEASKVDSMQETADNAIVQLKACQNALNRQKEENSSLESKLDDCNRRIHELEEINDGLRADMAKQEQKSSKTLEDFQEYKNKYDLLLKKQEEMSESHAKVEERVSAAKDEASFALTREKNLKRQNEMQAEEIKELEDRLEQALTRWRQEKEMVASETGRCTRLRENCANMSERLNKNASEIERLTRRLHMYDSLPMPEEIKARFRDFEEDARRHDQEMEDFSNQKLQLKDKLSDLEQKLNSALTDLEEANGEVSKLRMEDEQKSSKIEELSEALSSLTDRFSSSTTLIEMLETEKQNLLNISEKLRRDVSEREDELAAMRASRRKERKVELKKSASAVVSSSLESSQLTVDSELDEKEHSDIFEDSGKTADLENDKAGESAVMEKKKAEIKKSVSLPQFGKGSVNGMMALVKAAVETKENSEKLQETASQGCRNDLLERKRKMDADAKVRVQQALEHGGATQIMTVVYENMHCENTCWRGVRAIRNLCVESESVKAKCLEAKCDELMLAGLTAFPKSGITQAQCLRGLAALCFGNDVVRRRCGENGVMKRIVIAFESHFDDSSVVHHGCTALTNLAHNNVDNRMRYKEAGGVEAVIYAISQHWQESAKLTRQGLWALLTLAGTDEISIEIVECGGAKLISESMVFHSDDAGVQQFGSWAISNLSLASEDVRMKIRKLGIIEICRIALEKHAGDVEVVRQCRHALGVLGPDGDSKGHVPSQGRRGTRRSTIGQNSKSLSSPVKRTKSKMPGPRS